MLNNKKNDKKYGIIVKIVVTLAVAALCFGVFKKLTKKETADFVRTQTVNVTHLSYGTIEKEISVTGIIQPLDNSTVTAKCSGELLEVFVKNGDKVKKGDLICVLNNKKAIDAAKLSYEQAKNTYDRYSKIYSSGNLSKQSFEDYKTSYERAKLEYETQVEYGKPIANIDGTIDGLELSLNTMVTNGKTICYINSEGLNEVKFGVSERVLKGVNVGDKVLVAKQGVTYDAEVTSVSKQVNTQTGQFDVRAMIKSENSLASGVMVKCTFAYEKKDNISYLSRNIVYYEGEEPFVYTVKDENVIEKKFLKIGIENDENVEIISGVDDSTKIISTWSNDLAEGALVKINKDEPGKKEISVKSTIKESEIIEDKDIATSSEILIDESIKKEVDVSNETINKNENKNDVNSNITETTKDVETSNNSTADKKNATSSDIVIGENKEFNRKDAETIKESGKKDIDNDIKKTTKSIVAKDEATYSEVSKTKGKLEE